MRVFVVASPFVLPSFRAHFVDLGTNVVWLFFSSFLHSGVLSAALELDAVTKGCCFAAGLFFRALSLSNMHIAFS